MQTGAYPVLDNVWSKWQQGYSEFIIRITQDCSGRPPAQEHHQDWVLHLGGLKLQFKDTFRLGDSFQWAGVEFQKVFNDWTASTVTRIGIEEMAAANRLAPSAAPWAPMLVEALPSGENGLQIWWWGPLRHFEAPKETSYTIQWKLASESWDDSAAVPQREVGGGPRGSLSVEGPKEGALYSMRVIAGNTAGDGPPSEETLDRPESGYPRFVSAKVNGKTLPCTQSTPKAAYSWVADLPKPPVGRTRSDRRSGAVRGSSPVQWA